MDMDRNIINIACFFLLFFFTFSSARTPFDSTHQINPLLDDNSILLPSQKTEPAATLIQYEPPEETKMEVQTATDQPSNPLPFTVFRFHPSRIPTHPLPLSFRPVHHRCHHNHHHKPWIHNRHFPRHHRNDVINNNNAPVARGGARRIPAEWMRFGHVNDPMEKSELLRRLYHRYNQRRQDPAEPEPEPEPEIKDTGLVKKIRKFLNRF